MTGFFARVRQRRWDPRLYIKDVVERVAAALVLIAATPVMIVAAIAVAIADGRPVLYSQDRVGKDGRLFRILKFRTMRVNTLTVAETGDVTAEHPLVTPLGRFLRRTKIDELPQLLSVLKGDMAMVGPRPTVLEQVEKYDAFQRRRLEMRPGLTGWTAVNGGTSFTWEERIVLDVWYIDHWSLALDLMILARTPAVLLSGGTANPAALARAREHADKISGKTPQR